MTYNQFAQVYDSLMDHSLYPKWVDYVDYFLKGNESILELGCGSGRLGILLKQAGYDITGLDQSNEMLSLAYHHQQQEQTYFPLIEEDMRQLPELDSYEAVISFCDSLCYIDKKKELQEIFHSVYRILAEDGVFLFDVHSTYQMHLFEEYSYHAELKGLYFLWDSFPGEYPYSVEHELVFFIERESGLYEKVQEDHKERTYPLDEYKDMLKQAGFSEIEVLADFTEPVQETSERWFFKAKK